MVECFKVGIIWRGLIHDFDKLRIGYFLAYQKYKETKKYIHQQPEVLYPRTGNRAMNKEILRHRKRSPHHWQYYAYGKKNPDPIPDKYIKEMVCDWKAAAKARGRKDLIGWYLEGRDNMVLHKDTRVKVDKLMGV